MLDMQFTSKLSVHKVRPPSFASAVGVLARAAVTADLRGRPGNLDIVNVPSGAADPTVSGETEADDNTLARIGAEVNDDLSHCAETSACPGITSTDWAAPASGNLSGVRAGCNA